VIFKGTPGQLRDIVQIQSMFRMWRAKRDYERLKIMVEKIKVI
jgi:hypothetical protein